MRNVVLSLIEETNDGTVSWEKAGTFPGFFASTPGRHFTLCGRPGKARLALNVVDQDEGTIDVIDAGSSPNLGPLLEALHREVEQRASL